MATLLINDIPVEGKYTIISQLDDTAQPHVINTILTLEINKYFYDNIKRIDSDKAVMEDISVRREWFGSEDDLYYYEMNIGRFTVKGERS